MAKLVNSKGVVKAEGLSEKEAKDIAKKTGYKVVSDKKPAAKAKPKAKKAAKK
jgi:hypothetical protein